MAQAGERARTVDSRLPGDRGDQALPRRAGVGTGTSGHVLRAVAARTRDRRRILRPSSRRTLSPWPFSSSSRSSRRRSEPPTCSTTSSATPSTRWRSRWGAAPRHAASSPSGRDSTSRSVGSASMPTSSTGESSPIASWSPAGRATSRASWRCSPTTWSSGPTAGGRSGRRCGPSSDRSAARASSCTWPRRPRARLAPRPQRPGGDRLRARRIGGQRARPRHHGRADRRSAGRHQPRQAATADRGAARPRRGSDRSRLGALHSADPALFSGGEISGSNMRRRTLPAGVRGSSSTRTKLLGSGPRGQLLGDHRTHLGGHARNCSTGPSSPRSGPPRPRPVHPTRDRRASRRRRRDARMRDDDAFDEVRPDLLAAGDDDVVESSRDGQDAVGRPAVRRRRSRTRTAPHRADDTTVASVPVAAQQHGCADEDLSLGRRPRRPSASDLVRPIARRSPPRRAGLRRTPRRSPSRSCRTSPRRSAAARRCAAPSQEHAAEDRRVETVQRRRDQRDVGGPAGPSELLRRSRLRSRGSPTPVSR